MTKTIGIIGGMGPLATADLFTKIILFTDADCDQEHMHVLIDNNTNIPDRTAAILHEGASPLPELEKSAAALARAGADFLIMPCNTAHYFHEDLQKRTKLPVLHMLRLTVETLQKRGYRRVGLLATDGTLATGLYDRLLEQGGIAAIKPDETQQALVMSLIYDDVKGGRVRTDSARLSAMLTDMQQKGAEAFLLGCTELPVAFAREDFGVPTVDPTAVLARAAILYAGGKVKD